MEVHDIGTSRDQCPWGRERKNTWGRKEEEDDDEHIILPSKKTGDWCIFALMVCTKEFDKR